MDNPYVKVATVTLRGETPMLMHADNIEWADELDHWKDDSNNRKMSKPGDDRTPPWRWIGSLYYDDPNAGVVTIPSENIMRSIMEGAAGVPVPGGKGGKTFKSQSQSGLLCRDFCWPLLVNGNAISMRNIQEFRNIKDFREHVQRAQALGFTLYTKRSRIGMSKHIRVRPRFDNWSVSGEILITDEQITKDILRDILSRAGKYKGLCDWRPSSNTPGPWGMYRAEVA